MESKQLLLFVLIYHVKANKSKYLHETLEVTAVLVFARGSIDIPANTIHDPMLDQCWANVVDGGPTLVQHWIHVSCLLGYLRPEEVLTHILTV